MPEPSPHDAVRRAARVAALVGPALAPADHRQLLDAVVATGLAMFDAAACSVSLWDEAREELVFVAAAGAGADAIVGERLPVGRGIAGWVLASGDAIAVGDVTADPRFARDVAERTGYVPRSILTAPLETERRTLGVLQVLDAQRVGAGPEALPLLSLFARQVALSIDGARACSDLGRVLLDAIAAAGDGDPLTAGLRDLSLDLPAPTADLARLAAAFAELDELGHDEHQAALALVEQLLAYVRARAAFR